MGGEGRRGEEGGVEGGEEGGWKYGLTGGADVNFIFN